jgi:hypothetical protein
MPNDLDTKFGFREETGQKKGLERYTHVVAATDPRRAAPKVFSRVTFMFWEA